MTVTKEITQLEKSSVKLSVTIGKDDVRSEYDELLSTYTKSLQIPGFRKGKVPREVLVRKFADALKNEAMEKIIGKSVQEIFEDETFPKESKPLPYSTPQLQDEPEMDLEKDFQFSVVYDVLPIVKIEKWEGLEVEIPDVSITDDDVARELEEIRERNSIVLDKDEGGTAASGDVLTVDYCELDSEGKAAGTEREDFTFTLGSGQNIYKFDDEVTGMKKDETREFTKTFPEDFDDKDLAGTAKKISVTLKALKIKKLPDLDDDLAQDVDEKYKTLEDLKNSIRERLNRNMEYGLKNIKINKLLEKIMENTPVEIPESMIRLELDARWRNMARRLNTDTDGLYKIMERSGEQAGSILENWKPEAIKALHSRLIVETLMEEMKLEASDEETEKEIERIAVESATDLEEMKKTYENEQLRELLKEDIKEKKVFDILLEKSTIRTGKKENYIDLAAKYR